MEAEYGALAGIAGVALLFLVFFFLLIIAAFVVIIIAKWKILVKAGEEGWKAIIPIYGDMVLCKCVGVWEFYPLVLLAISLFSGMIGDSSYVSGTISLLSSAVTIYYGVILNISVAQSFGKDSGFGIGLMLLGFVFYPMLGFGKSQYIGKKPMNDPIINSIFKDQNGASNQGSTPAPEANVAEEKPATEETPAAETPAEEAISESTDEVKPQGNFCPSCGAANSEESAFCQKCGNKLN